MKTLKLDASKDEARKLARALIGSEDIYCKSLISVIDGFDYAFVRIKKNGLIDTYSTIEIPVDKIKLDPRVEHCGWLELMVKSDRNYQEQLWTISEYGLETCDSENLQHSDYELDLDWASSLDGVEVIG